MQKYNLLFFILLCISAHLSAQTISRKEIALQDFDDPGKYNLTLSTLCYKEGDSSLEWNFSSGSILPFRTKTPFILDEKKEQQYGITLWIYNEKQQQDSIRFEFFSPQGKVSYWFSFRLASAGWRACWIGFQHMKGNKRDKEIAGFRIIAPERKGRIFLDRLVFPVKQMNSRVTPDQQMPYNNSLPHRDLWHWCRAWEWEQYTYDTPLPTLLSNKEMEDLQLVERRLSDALDITEVPEKAIAMAYQIFGKANIRVSGSRSVGVPIVAIDEQEHTQGELGLRELNAMLSGFAYDAYYNHSKQSEDNYFLIWNYAINQGFAYGSGMGTNRHHGYLIREIYTTAWLMREAIWKAKNKEDIISTLVYWSSLAETRKPFQYGRREVMDNWNTLTVAKMVSALMFFNVEERARALKALSRWTSNSLQYSPGVIGGIKRDGTTFHHEGFYPAYTSGALAALGQFAYWVSHTRYEITETARKLLKSAFIAMRNYSNKYEWGIGLSGRHPFGGQIQACDVAAYAYLALSGDLSAEGNEFDYQLASDYLRLCQDDTPEARYFRAQGIQEAVSPQGFWVYNYGAAGIFRRNNWMVTLKGYNTDVWGAEIYTRDNRYGRYQGYGSVQIMGQSSRKASGYDENGWDWNRVPGTTTIHLPLDLLNDPSDVTMLYSKEQFAGSNSLEQKHGMFTIKLMECAEKNFTPDFVARKSVFCFENRMICMGTGISNSNHEWPTETTLFQSSFIKDTHLIKVGGIGQREIGFEQDFDCNKGQLFCIEDSYGNYYYIKKGRGRVQIANQESRHEKKQTITHGVFASAWIEHGKAPHNEAYEYMIWVQPTNKELQKYKTLQTYKVLQQNDTAHIVYDCLTGITAYSIFDIVSLKMDSVFISLPAETMIMRKNDHGKMKISVCTPDLNFDKKNPNSLSHIIKKQLRVKGAWKVETHEKRVNILQKDKNTLIEVICQDGQPVEFQLLPEQIF